MDNMSRPQRKEAYHSIARFCGYRLDGTLSEDEIADNLGFHSAEGMHRSLKNWGLPDWMIGNKAPKNEDKGRKARHSGDWTELPLAGEAEHLFREDLERLNRYQSELPFLQEYLHGKLFMSLLLSPKKGDNLWDPYDNSWEVDKKRIHQLADQGSIWTIVVAEEEEGLRHVLKMTGEVDVETIRVSKEEDLERLREMVEEGSI
jgi:hypothetical protein